MDNRINKRAWRLMLALIATGICVDASASTLDDSRSADLSTGLNVLFIAIDDFRPEIYAIGAHEVITPNLDRLAERGVYFERAYAQWPVCGPSRASIMTGLRPLTSGIVNQSTTVAEAVPAHTTMPQFFKKHGYNTASIGKIYHGKDEDLDYWDVVRRGLWSGYGDSKNRELQGTERPLFEREALPEENYTDAQNTEIALQLLEDWKDDRFFIAIGFYKPHMPFAAPEQFWNLYYPNALNVTRNRSKPSGASNATYQWTEIASYREFSHLAIRDSYEHLDVSESDVRQFKHGYYATVSFVDSLVGRLVERLESLDLADKTIICVWSDHGFHFGEQNIYGKHSLFEKSTNVPLLFYVPSASKLGTRSEAIVELVDVYPSLADLAGLPVPDNLDGVSLKPIMSGQKTAVKDYAVTNYWPSWVSNGYDRYFGTSVVSDQYRYIVWQDVNDNFSVIEEELYDYSSERVETTNIIAEFDTDAIPFGLGKAGLILGSENKRVKPQ